MTEPTCPNGHDVLDGDEFCGECGSALPTADDQPAPDPAPAVTSDASYYKRLVIFGVLLAAVCIGIIVVSTRGGDGDSNENAFAPTRAADCAWFEKPRSSWTFEKMIAGSDCVTKETDIVRRNRFGCAWVRDSAMPSVSAEQPSNCTNAHLASDLCGLTLAQIAFPTDASSYGDEIRLPATTGGYVSIRVSLDSDYMATTLITCPDRMTTRAWTQEEMDAITGTSTATTTAPAAATTSTATAATAATTTQAPTSGGFDFTDEANVARAGAVVNWTWGVTAKDYPTDGLFAPDMTGMESAVLGPEARNAGCTQIVAAITPTGTDPTDPHQHLFSLTLNLRCPPGATDYDGAPIDTSPRDLDVVIETAPRPSGGWWVTSAELDTP